MAKCQMSSGPSRPIFNQMSYLFISGFGLWRGKKEWVGNSLKTIVLTAVKDIDPSYSQFGHIAEGLWALQFSDRVIKYYKLIFILVTNIAKNNTLKASVHA